MSDFCNTCPSRSFCQSICPELEMHLKELEVPQRELLIHTPRYGKFPTPRKRIKLTKKERQIVTFLAEGKNYAEISQAINITKDNVRKIVQRMRQKVA